MRLLVVEDERSLAASLRRGLEVEGYWVDVAHDGNHALDLIRDAHYDGIILDVMLPGLNGYEVCRRLRADGDQTPILMLTAKDGEYEEADALDLGADDYQTKPFSFVVLAARLRKLLGRRDRDQRMTLIAGDLELDLGARMCRRGDQQITLTAREFEVLAYLVERSGTVVAKLDLLNDVWDWAADLDPNLVEVYVSSLRRKVDTPFGRRAIQTIRGVGYRIAADGG